MDSVEQLKLTRELIDIDSTTGREAEAGEWIASRLQALGYEVARQVVAGDRFNIIATTGRPTVVLSTHYDCVPPFFPSRVEGDRLYGRGSCDAKGALVAQVAAAERLRASGESAVGLLFVVGEEKGSEGAHAARDIAPGSRFLIDGEPTDNRLGTATRGVYRARLVARGRAAHTSQPDLGDSAIERLIDALVAVRDVEWPEDPVLGRTFYVVGLMSGGVAPNVIPPEAEAEMMFRTVGPHETLREMTQRRVGRLATVEDVLVVPPVHLKTVPGFATAAFAFTTDIPFLTTWGEPLLLGPGSVEVAHTGNEHVAIPELDRAVDLYADLARTLMSQAG
jgi:acetylornithine deacetylase